MWSPSQLPAGWEAHVEARGRLVYVNRNTKTVHRIPPKECWGPALSLALPPEGSLSRLPYGWEQALMPTGEPYYIDHASQASRIGDPRLPSAHGRLTSRVQHLTLTVQRDPTAGFGFIATGGRPVHIKSVDASSSSSCLLEPRNSTTGNHGSTAAAAATATAAAAAAVAGGLQVGDEILEINGRDVREAGLDVVLSNMRDAKTLRLRVARGLVSASTAAGGGGGGGGSGGDRDLRAVRVFIPGGASLAVRYADSTRVTSVLEKAAAKQGFATSTNDLLELVIRRRRHRRRYAQRRGRGTEAKVAATTTAGLNLNNEAEVEGEGSVEGQTAAEDLRVLLDRQQHMAWVEATYLAEPGTECWLEMCYIPPTSIATLLENDSKAFAFLFRQCRERYCLGDNNGDAYRLDEAASGSPLSSKKTVSIANLEPLDAFAIAKAMDLAALLVTDWMLTVPRRQVDVSYVEREVGFEQFFEPRVLATMRPKELRKRLAAAVKAHAAAAAQPQGTAAATTATSDVQAKALSARLAFVEALAGASGYGQRSFTCTFDGTEGMVTVSPLKGLTLAPPPLSAAQRDNGTTKSGSKSIGRSVGDGAAADRSRSSSSSSSGGSGGILTAPAPRRIQFGDVRRMTLDVLTGTLTLRSGLFESTSRSTLLQLAPTAAFELARLVDVYSGRHAVPPRPAPLLTDRSYSVTAPEYACVHTVPYQGWNYNADAVSVHNNKGESGRDWCGKVDLSAPVPPYSHYVPRKDQGIPAISVEGRVVYPETSGRTSNGTSGDAGGGGGGGDVTAWEVPDVPVPINSLTPSATTASTTAASTATATTATATTATVTSSALKNATETTSSATGMETITVTTPLPPAPKTPSSAELAGDENLFIFSPPPPGFGLGDADKIVPTPPFVMPPQPPPMGMLPPPPEGGDGGGELGSGGSANGATLVDLGNLAGETDTDGIIPPPVGFDISLVPPPVLDSAVPPTTASEAPSDAESLLPSRAASTAAEEEEEEENMPPPPPLPQLPHSSASFSYALVESYSDGVDPLVARLRKLHVDIKEGSIFCIPDEAGFAENKSDAWDALSDLIAVSREILFAARRPAELPAATSGAEEYLTLFVEAVGDCVVCTDLTRASVSALLIRRALDVLVDFRAVLTTCRQANNIEPAAEGRGKTKDGIGALPARVTSALRSARKFLHFVRDLSPNQQAVM